MSNYAGLGDLVEQIKQASANIRVTDERNCERLNAIEQSVNELYKKAGRPGGFGGDYDTDERKSAIEMCHMRYADHLPKQDGTTKECVPSSNEIEEAMVARQAYRKVLRHGRTERLDVQEQKALSSFSFGTNGFVLPPERSNQVLSCLVDPSDITGLVNRVAISSSSISFLINSARMALGAWQCESNCFANNPTADLQVAARRTQHKS